MVDAKSVEDEQEIWPTAADRARCVAQAKELKEQASKGGLSFEVFLPPRLAAWLLDLVEREIFLDPREAAFVIFEEHSRLQPHADLRNELLKRTIQESLNNPRPSSSVEEVTARLKARYSAPRAEPAQWQRHKEQKPL